MNQKINPKCMQRGLLAGYSVTEILAATFIFALLISISLCFSSRAVKADPLNKATDQVVSLLNQTRAEAISRNKMVALILHNNELETSHYRRKLAVASFVENPENHTVDPEEDALHMERRWRYLPDNIILDCDYTSGSELPNAFSSAQQGTDGDTKITFQKEAVESSSPSERHRKVIGLIFDRFGAVSALRDDQWVQYVNDIPDVIQKGCYVILRNSQLSNREDELHTRKIYLSPLTGKVQKL